MTTLMPTTATTLTWRHILHLAVNEDKKECQLQQELMLDHAVPLPSYHYYDNLEQHDKQEVLTAMKKELDKLRQKDMYEDCDKSTLSQEQLRKIVKARWVVGDRPGPSTTTTKGVQPASELRAKFVAKGYSQHVNDPMVDCYAATPSITSLKTLLLLGILQGHQTTCLDVSTAFINAPLPETEEIYAQPAQDWYYDSSARVWRLKKTIYGRRTSPKLWQLHHGRVLQQQGLRQCKADRCLYTTTGLGVLVYVDDLLLAGEAANIDYFITTLKATFTLKHVTTLSGSRGEFNQHPFAVTTACLEQQLLEDREKLDPQQHVMFRNTVGQLIWASLD